MSLYKQANAFILYDHLPQMKRKPQVMFKTQSKPLSYYRSMTVEEQRQDVEANVAKLKEINDRRVKLLKQDSRIEEDMELTSKGFYDIPYHCDLYMIA